jgi:hypothetical protein
MRTDEAREQYKGRASLVENVNAQVKGRYGLTEVTVRGLEKVKCVALLVALAHNLAAHGNDLVEALQGRNSAPPTLAPPRSPSPPAVVAPDGESSPPGVATSLPDGR